MTSIDVQGFSKTYRVRGAGSIDALSDVSFTLSSGQTIGMVGQSGSGKSTVAKILTQMERPTSGQVLLDGRPVPTRGAALRAYRQRLRMVFQDDDTPLTQVDVRGGAVAEVTWPANVVPGRTPVAV